MKSIALTLVCFYSLWVLTGCGKDIKDEVGEVLLPPSNFVVQADARSAIFEWDAVDKADGYFLEIGTNSSFSEVVAKTDTTQQTKVQFSGLAPATVYYARLRAIHKINPSFTSNRLVETFTTTEEEQPEPALAFPGAEGYGKMTTGGRGGRVIKVTNLNDAGTGSLRAAVEASGPRIVVFEVSGNIKLTRRLNINNGDLTIAGQTAPGDGICIQDYEMTVAADNVIVRFMRFRMGDLTQNEQDALWGRYQQNVIIDHCSMSWSIDECSSFYANQDFTMQWCILSESLNQSFHNKNDHGYGAIWGGNRATFHHNLIAHHNSRNPRFDGGNRPGTGGMSPVGKDQVDYRNNVIYNWGANSAYGGENGAYNMVNNYYKPGPGTRNNPRRIMQVSNESSAEYAPGHGVFFIEGNYMWNHDGVTQNNWAGVDLSGGVAQAAVQAEQPFPHLALSVEHTAEQAFDVVLEKAGASYKRDAVDARVVQEVRDGTATYSGSKTGYAGIIDSQTDVGGWPMLEQATPPTDTDGDGMPDAWEIANNLNPNVPDANGRDLSEVYDNIEVYFNSLVNGLY
ncbi:pectate lyase [Sphingobacterium gobiense]|uniref:pectate lyase n=1 Tax=Sphingobacterium gobiense TaxID=1382456 RepID=UPI001C6149D6|nr:pectate lyase [Sphingobacterium gobiense]